MSGGKTKQSCGTTGAGSQFREAMTPMAARHLWPLCRMCSPVVSTQGGPTAPATAAEKPSRDRWGEQTATRRTLQPPVDIPLSTEGTLLSGSAPRGTIRVARVASLHAAHAARAQRKKHTHNAQNPQNVQHGVLEANLKEDFWHAQNA